MEKLVNETSDSDYIDFLEGDWVARKYRDGRVLRYKYIGVFAPNEPFLAVFYDDEKDALETELVIAIVTRVVQQNDVHYVEFLPVIVDQDGYFEFAISDTISNYVCMVPARIYEKIHDELLEEAREEWKIKKKST
ncbi:MAG: hypothetical protein JHC26_02125 [Thermofilum sp.]|jgi:hypothetical protein|uniref:hypothetical protein n=1 Tax=Thermofilum sp. TaxID=1961369 RepID=UPI002584C02B|nr:hypothetical protein [Thermofilum sp.]MCI4407861.1 hypothetical protein [Thermofilum sp.]